MKYKIYIFYLIILSVFFITDTLKCSEPTLGVEGILVHESKAIKGGVINVIYESKIESYTISRRNGRFDFTLDYGKEYIIEASKDGFITKKIIISTVIDDDIMKAGGVTEGFFDLQINMIEMVPGLNITVYNQPVRRYEFDRNSWLFYPDTDFENRIKDKLEEVINQLSVLKKEEYNNQIKTGDDLMNKSDYENAWMAYNKALKYYPKESYPKSQIKKIKKAIKALASTEEDYNNAIEKGDYYYSNENFRMAASFYEKALLYKPEEDYPAVRINDIDSIYNEIFIEKKTAYDKAISLANEYLANNDYKNAILYLNNAFDILPDEQYPRIKIAEIDESYEQIISDADSFYKVDKLTDAKELYTRARSIKPDEDYPVDMIDKIDRMVERSKQYEADRSEKEKEQEAENEYRSIVSQADNMLGKNDLANAKRFYRQALAMKPDEKYPKRKIEEIKKLASEKEKAEAALREKERAQEKDTQYSKLIKNAEDLFEKENYADAKKIFLKASKIKPGEKYPGRKIKEIDKILAEKEEQERLLAEKTEDITSDIDTAGITEDTEKKISKYREILEEKQQSGDKKGESDVLGDIGNIYHNNNKLGTAIDYYNKALQIKKETGDKEGTSVVLNDIAIAFYDSGRFETAIDNYKESYEINEELGNKKVSAVILDNIGQVYENTFQYENAVKFYEQSLDIVEELGEKEDQASLHDKMANVYIEQNNLEKAVESFQKSLEIDRQMNKEEDVAATLNNIGSALYDMGNINEAENYYEQSLTTTEKIGDRKQTSIALNNIGNINYDGSRFKKAIEFYEQSIKIKQDIDYKKGEAASLHNIGNAYKGMKDYNQAIDYYQRSNEVADQINYMEVVARNNRAFSEVYSMLKDYKKAYEYQKHFAELKQSIEDDKAQIFEGISKERREDDLVLIASLRRQIQKQKLLAEYEANRRKKEMEIKNLELENEKEKSKRQQLIIFVSLAGLIALIIFLVLIYRQYFQKKKANIELVEKNRLITYQKQQITDSITYASRIQKAVLPPNEFITRILPQHFILNKPRDIVSGDYYWTTQRGNESIIAVADCTGHGVPGAFMSMLGISFLNEIVNKSVTARSHEILDQLRSNVMTSLHQTGREDEAKDGMDIALLIVDMKEKVLQYSGAHNPLYLIRKEKMQEIKADKMPIGISTRYNKPFKNHKIKLFKDDMIYIFSDGYQDQFGGENRKKFGMRRFRELLMEIHNKPVKEQRDILDETCMKWKGDLGQIDDILVMGMRI
jgi:tetratricopeptide (TPR) repeat protein